MFFEKDGKQNRANESQINLSTFLRRKLSSYSGFASSKLPIISMHAAIKFYNKYSLISHLSIFFIREYSEVKST